VFTYFPFSGSGNLTVLCKFTPSPVAIATIQKLQNFALQPMEISQRYNLVTVKDNCALFAPIPLFLGLCYLTVSFKFLPPPTPVATATNFGTKLTITRPPLKIIARCLHLHLFSHPGYPMVSFKFFPRKPLLPWQRILEQNWLQLGPMKDNCSLFALTPYFRARAIRLCHLNFFLPTPVAMETNFGAKLTITRLLQKIIARCFHLPPIFGPRLCNGVM